MAEKRQPASALFRRQLAIDSGVLIAFWLLFYYRIWNGDRHIGFDMDGYNYPLDHYISESLRLSKTLPQWDWFTYNGSDFAGNIQSAMFYPPKLAFELLLALFGIELSFPAYQFFALLQVLAMSIASYAVCRAIRIGRFWSCIAALTLTYTGVLQAQVEHFWFIATLPWLPLVAYGAIQLCRTKSRTAIAVYLVASVCMLLVGYPLQYLTIQIEVIFASLCISALEPGFSLKRGLRSIGILAASQILALGVGAIILLPFLRLLTGSIADASGTWFPLQSALTMVYPEAVGSLSGNFSLPSDRTTTYYYPGVILILTFAASPLIVKFQKHQRKWIAAAGAITLINFILLFTPTIAKLSTVLPALNYIRPQTVGMPFAVTLTVYCVGMMIAAEKATPVWLHTPIRIVSTIACVTLFFNMPAFFSTPTGPASGVASFVGGDIVNRSTLDLRRYSIVIDSHTAGDDPWARVLDTRFLGGFDPLAQLSYLKLLDEHKVHNESRQTFFGEDADFTWLADNGTRFVMSDNPQLISLAKKVGWTLLQSSPYSHLFQLPSARPLASAACATTIDGRMTTNQLAISYDMPLQTCPIRLTSNYSPYFFADHGIEIAPIKGELGMQLSGVTAHSGTITLTYRNPYFSVGRTISFFSALICLVALAFLIANRNVPVEARFRRG